MEMGSIAIIGFGEAAQAFAPELTGSLVAYDRKIAEPATRADKLNDGARLGVEMAGTNAAAVAGVGVGVGAILSLVTAGQAGEAAAETARAIAPGAFFFDMNSVAPDTKRDAARVVAAAAGRYVDVAVMAPVHPAGCRVPLLVGGPHAEDGARLLRSIGFARVDVVGDTIGTASAIKMIRSILVKGIEALSAECVIAAEAAGVRAEVLASLDASRSQADWPARIDYNLDRMLVHGSRRAEEMAEVVKTIEALGIAATMSHGTVERQREIGGLRLASPDGLDAKLACLAPHLSLRKDG